MSDSKSSCDKDLDGNGAKGGGGAERQNKRVNDKARETPDQHPVAAMIIRNSCFTLGPLEDLPGAEETVSEYTNPSLIQQLEAKVASLEIKAKAAEKTLKTLTSL
jgi:hypothetical protein